MKVRHTEYRWPPWERLPLSATLRFNSTLQCGRCVGCLHPHNPRGRKIYWLEFNGTFSTV